MKLLTDFVLPSKRRTGIQPTRTCVARLLMGLVCILAGAFASAAFSQTTLSFREGSNGYSHVAALIRGDNTSLNSGARDQLIVGKTSAGVRVVWSFGLGAIPTDATVTSIALDIWTQSTNSLGTVGALELHALAGVPTEGTGDGSGTGTGTGVTWLSRDGQSGTGHSWTNAGGDFSAPVLSSVPSFVASLVTTQRTFASTASFLASAQAAVSQGQPLNLLLYSPTTEAGANNIYTRISSDDFGNASERPRLTITFVGDPAPTALGATAVSWSEMALSWNENLTNETGFVIERMTGTTGAWATVISTGPNVTSALNFGLEPATSYSYRVKAMFADGSSSPYAVSGAATTLAATPRSPLVVMPLGDSITQGASQPASVPGGYRGPLYTLLTNAGYQISFVGSDTNNSTTALTATGNATHEGHGGYTTTNLLNNLDANAGTSGNNGGHWLDGIAGTRPAVYPDVILLMAGVNDLGVNQLSAAQGLAGLEALLSKLVTMRPAARIVVSTLTPYIGSVYPLREQHQLEFNVALPTLITTHQAAGHRVTLCDVRTRISITNAAALLCSDGVHPNQAGYNAIADVWIEAFAAIPMIENWRRLNFGSPAATGSAADAEDWDGDGASNLAEYALGTNPTNGVPEHPLQAGIVTNFGTNFLSLTFPRRKHADVSYVVELAPTLSSPTAWTTGGVQMGSPVPLNADFEQVTVRDTVPISSAGAQFMRLKMRTQ